MPFEISVASRGRFAGWGSPWRRSDPGPVHSWVLRSPSRRPASFGGVLPSHVSPRPLRSGTTPLPRASRWSAAAVGSPLSAVVPATASTRTLALDGFRVDGEGVEPVGARPGNDATGVAGDPCSAPIDPTAAKEAPCATARGAATRRATAMARAGPGARVPASETPSARQGPKQARRTPERTMATPHARRRRKATPSARGCGDVIRNDRGGDHARRCRHGYRRRRRCCPLRGDGYPTCRGRRRSPPASRRAQSVRADREQRGPRFVAEEGGRCLRRVAHVGEPRRACPAGSPGSARRDARRRHQPARRHAHSARAGGGPPSGGAGRPRRQGDDRGRRHSRPVPPGSGRRSERRSGTRTFFSPAVPAEIPAGELAVPPALLGHVRTLLGG